MSGPVLHSCLCAFYLTHITMLSTIHRFNWLSSLGSRSHIMDYTAHAVSLWTSWAVRSAKARKVVPVEIETLRQNVIILNDLSATRIGRHLGPDQMCDPAVSDLTIWVVSSLKSPTWPSTLPPPQLWPEEQIWECCLLTVVQHSTPTRPPTSSSSSETWDSALLFGRLKCDWFSHKTRLVSLIPKQILSI